MTVLESDTRLRVAGAIEKNEADATLKALEGLAQRSGMDQPPPLASDGHNGCAEAMVEVWGKAPQRKKGPGRPPKKKAAAPSWQHLKVVKNRQEKLPSAQLPNPDSYREVVFGQVDEVSRLLGHGTVHVERTHLTMRHFNGRLVRKGLGFSKKLEMHRAAAAWENLYYNFGHTVRTLKVPANTVVKGRFKIKWIHRTPAWAAGLASHIWSVKELLYSIPIQQHFSG